MNREIKFRAWNKDDSNIMFDPMNHPNGIRFQTCLSVPSIDIMQYTGLKDKSGKEIYEGDILTQGGMPVKVIFEYGSFRYECLDWGVYSGGRKEYLFSEGMSDWEIIGNIHENKELLNQRK